jgi:putative oxygen-independent coproporphyrinogen III oxidase
MPGGRHLRGGSLSYLKMSTLFPPLSLYLHFPWCVEKCPYCDFNSHPARQPPDQHAYVDALLADLAHDLPLVGDRPVRTVFLGGGTPSLFDPHQIARLMAGLAERLPLAADLEVTLEANPGTVEAGRFAGYRAAGVNRLSIGVQSLDAAKLRALGRIHGPAEAVAAAQAARAAGFDSFNLDLMFGLPQQDLAQALDDLAQAIELAPPHLSWYQLTVEPNTRFAHQPPPLPDDDLLWDMQAAGQRLLADAGLEQYEISAYARPGQQCRHNLNYWSFGDYLGIGAGAHGKLTLADGRILRHSKQRHPQAYLAGAGSAAAIAGERWLGTDDLPVEFMMNALRLNAGVDAVLYGQHTGSELAAIAPLLAQARGRGLLDTDTTRLAPTALGRRFLNDLLAVFEVDHA